MKTEARFPQVAAGAGHYESFYLKAAHPAGGRSVWLRHTTHQRPGEEPKASIWLTLFDSEAAGPKATKATFGTGDLAAPTGTYIEVGGAILEPGRAHGVIDTDGVAASWELSFDEGAEPLRHLPREYFYRSRLPKTKLESPYPYTHFNGTVRLGDTELELEGWPGMMGHNWGAEHAERWVWIQAADLGGNAGDYLDVAAGKVRVGPLTTPWIANGRLVLEGESYVLGGISNAYGTQVDERPDGCEFTFPGKDVNVKGMVRAPLKDFVAWIYADPKGPQHNALNCSIADIELKVERPGKRHGHASVARAAVYELGTRDTGHGIPLQPYPDG